MRTDEGTPLSLADLRGRAFALFLLGDDFSAAVERLLIVLSEETGRFFSMNCSPIAVMGAPCERMAAFREQHDVPYVMISDSDLALHGKFTGETDRSGGAWIVNRHGIVVDIVPALPPSELVRLSLVGTNRTISIPAQKKSD
jgi:peroxiredoxin